MLTLKDIIESEVPTLFSVWAPHLLRVLSPFNFSKTICLATDALLHVKRIFKNYKSLFKTVLLGIPHVMTETHILMLVLPSSTEGESPPWPREGQTASAEGGKRKVFS